MRSANVGLSHCSPPHLADIDIVLPPTRCANDPRNQARDGAGVRNPREGGEPCSITVRARVGFGSISFFSPLSPRPRFSARQEPTPPPRARTWPASSFPTRPSKPRNRFRAGDYATPDKVTRKAMPAFCRVVASVKGAPDSDIRIEMWLPKEGWTGVFHSNGNGGYGGIFDLGYAGMEAAVKRGYASANTDMGTAPSNPLNGDPLIGHPQKWKDWGSLSTHVMTRRRQGYRQGLLWRGAEAFVLHGLLHRRPAGADRSGILSRRL